MAAVVYSTPGKLYLDPTTATTGGTEIGGIEERRITLELEVERTIKRKGLRGGHRVFLKRYGPARLRIPLRSQAADAVKILLSPYTDDGLQAQPMGGNALGEGKVERKFAIVLRPDDTTELYLYSPYWQPAPETIIALTWQEDEPVYQASEIVLIAGYGTTTVPPFLFDTAANIDTAYGLGGGA